MIRDTKANGRGTILFQLLPYLDDIDIMEITYRDVTLPFASRAGSEEFWAVDNIEGKTKHMRIAVLTRSSRTYVLSKGNWEPLVAFYRKIL